MFKVEAKKNIEYWKTLNAKEIPVYCHIHILNICVSVFSYCKKPKFHMYVKSRIPTKKNSYYQIVVSNKISQFLILWPNELKIDSC